MYSFWGLRRKFVEDVSPALRDAFDLEVSDVFLLEYICRSDLSPSAIGAQLRLPAHTISRRLDALEKRQLLVRSLDPNDARRRVLNLTPAGEALLEAAARLLEQQVTALLEVLEPGTLAGMLDALERVVQNQPKPTQSHCTPPEEAP